MTQLVCGTLCMVVVGGMQLIPQAVLFTHWPLREHGCPSEGRGL